MNDEDREIVGELHKHQLRDAQIIALCLIVGAASFLAIILLLPQLGGKMPFGAPILTWICLPAGFAMVLVGLVIPDIAARRQLRRERADLSGLRPFPMPRNPSVEAVSRMDAFRTRLLIRLALLEGAAFFSLIAYMLERQWPSLMVAVVMMAVMAANFPTRGRMDHWMEEMANAE